MNVYSLQQAFAVKEDENDPLRHYREEFFIPTKNGQDVCYFAGNSLGLQPKAAAQFVGKELDQWKNQGVEGHQYEGNPWVSYHEPLSMQMASIIGSLPGEVVCMNSLTVNLHLMMVSFYRPTAERYKILVNSRQFSSDTYALQSQVKYHDLDPKEVIIELAATEEGIVSEGEIEKILEEQGSSIALVFIEGVNYFTGQSFDIKNISAQARKNGCIVGFDLAHAVGNCRLDLHDDGVDFAIWCSYKYLNGGPGCTGGCFVHEKHHKQLDIPRFAGWWGHDFNSRFLMGPDFQPIVGAKGWQLSNPPILALASLKASLEIFQRATMKQLREKSIKLTGYLEYLLHSLKDDQLQIITPAEAGSRGCQLSVRIKSGAEELVKKLSLLGFICDYRPPNVIRLAPVPLYNSFLDVYRLYASFK